MTRGSEAAKKYGTSNSSNGFLRRSIYIIGPDGKVRYRDMRFDPVQREKATPLSAPLFELWAPRKDAVNGGWSRESDGRSELDARQRRAFLLRVVDVASRSLKNVHIEDVYNSSICIITPVMSLLSLCYKNLLCVL